MRLPDVAQLDEEREPHARVRLGEPDHRLELPRRRGYPLFGRTRVVAYYAAELQVGLHELVRGLFGYCGVDARAAVVDVRGELVQWLYIYIDSMPGGG